MEIKYDIEWAKKQEQPDFLFFWGDTGTELDVIDQKVFSQWYYSPFSEDGITYPTAEHYMMAKKALLFDNMNIYNQILNSKEPQVAKMLGRSIEGFKQDVWNQHKFDIVYQGNILKFSQNKKLLDYLLSTEEKIIVEASPYDTIWGIGLGEKDPKAKNIETWNGENLLGFVLMEARDFFRKKESHMKITNEQREAEEEEIKELTNPIVQPTFTASEVYAMVADLEKRLSESQIGVSHEMKNMINKAFWRLAGESKNND